MFVKTSTITLAIGLGLSIPFVGFASAQVGSPVPAPGAPNTLTGVSGGTVGSGANNSRPVGGPDLTGVPYVKTHKRHNKNFYGKHYNVMKHSKM
jgi:hypothetical protein